MKHILRRGKIYAHTSQKIGNLRNKLETIKNENSKTEKYSILN